MAAATNTFSPDDRPPPSMADSPPLSAQYRQFGTDNTNATPHRPRQHLDDADLLTWKRQYANIGLREGNVMSNSADDLSQLIDHIPYPFETSAQDYNDADDDELHFDNGNNYDYDVSIQERLKRANAVFEHDATPAELTHEQRVSFDAVVKAVDITREIEVDNNTDHSAAPSIEPVVEETSTNAISSQNESNPHEYTVPLNDTQPKEGPTLLEQIKAMQFHGGPLIGERRPITNTKTTNGSSTREDDSPSSKSNSNNNTDIPDMTKSSSSSKKSMLVSINGGFELQNEDDYTAKYSSKEHQINSNNDNKKSSTKVTFTPTPPTEAKQRQESEVSHRPYPSITRPKSNDNGKRTDTTTSKSLSDNRNKSATNKQQRSKSAGVSKSIESFIIKPSSVDFEELNRKAAEKKRAELREEHRKKEEAEAKRKVEEAKARESFEKWVRDKDAERKRFNEEKRMEKEEQEIRQTQCEKELAELREKKYKEWIERKNQEAMFANEFKKLQADEEEIASGGSSSSIQNSNRRSDHRAFHRWLRRKYEQSKEEKRQLRLETRRLRRHQRRSIKRFQLQQDLQLAKAFGYS